jgi:DNA-binding response OmpR family regulator
MAPAAPLFVAVYPPAPSQSLAGALIAAGYQPLPIESVGDLAGRASNAASLVVEAGEDLGLSLATSRKARSEHGVAVLLIADRTLTADLVDHDDFDDFLLTPIDRVELATRLRRLSPATTPQLEREADPDVLRFDDLELNTATYQATLAGIPQDLTYMEYELLKFLVEHPVRVWSREQILSKVWGYDYFGGSRTVDVHIRRLRAKLGEERRSWITTVRSVGYRFG